jgi:hypothetical protein
LRPHASTFLTIVFVLLLALSGSSFLSAAERGHNAAANGSSLEQQRFQLEKEKLELDRRKLNLEIEAQALKTRAESREDRKVIWTAASTAIPLIVALGTLLAGWWSLQRTTVSAFETKLLETALDGTSSRAALNRAKLAAALTGKRLRVNIDKIAEDIDSGKYGAVGRLPTESLSTRATVLALLWQYPDKRADILRDLDALFPSERWGAAITRAEDPSRSLAKSWNLTSEPVWDSNRNTSNF